MRTFPLPKSPVVNAQGYANPEWLRLFQGIAQVGDAVIVADLATLVALTEYLGSTPVALQPVAEAVFPDVQAVRREAQGFPVIEAGLLLPDRFPEPVHPPIVPHDVSFDGLDAAAVRRIEERLNNLEMRVL